MQEGTIYRINCVGGAGTLRVPQAIIAALETPQRLHGWT